MCIQEVMPKIKSPYHKKCKKKITRVRDGSGRLMNYCEHCKEEINEEGIYFR